MPPRLNRKIDRLAASRDEKQNGFTRRALERGLHGFRAVHGLAVDLQNDVATCDTCIAGSSVRIDTGYDHSFSLSFNTKLTRDLGRYRLKREAQLSCGRLFLGTSAAVFRISIVSISGQLELVKGRRQFVRASIAQHCDFDLGTR